MESHALILATKPTHALNLCRKHLQKSPLAVGTGTWGIAAVIPKYLRLLFVGEYLRVESECLMHGFSEEQTDKLVHGQALKFRGYLQADKRSPRVWAESVTAQIIRIAKDKLQLTIEQSPIIQWIQQQLEHNKKEQSVEEQNVSNHRGFHL